MHTKALPVTMVTPRTHSPELGLTQGSIRDGQGKVKNIPPLATYLIMASMLVLVIMRRCNSGSEKKGFGQPSMLA